MSESDQLRGGVVTGTREDARGIVALLTAHLQHHFNLHFYERPTDIDFELRHDFVLVLGLADLRGVINLFDGKKILLPLLVHVDSPAELYEVNYRTLFPGVRILSVPQAPLDNEPDVTLELSLYSKIRRALTP